MNTITIQEIQNIITEATNAGYSAYIVINGEIYDIKK